MSTDDGGPQSRLKDLGRLLFPGVVAVCLSVPSLVPGALAFDIRRDFAFNAAEIGAIVAVFYLFSTLFTRLVVPLLDRFGPMALTRWGLALSAVGMLTAAGLGSKPGLWTMCVVGGMANGVATPSANMLIALTVPVRRQGLAFGLRVSAVPGAAAIAAAGAFIVASTGLGWRHVVAASALALLALLASSLVASSVRAGRQSRPASDTRGQGLASLRVLALGGLLAATACATLSPFLVEGLIAGGADPGAAAFLLGVSAWVGVGARVLAGVVADRFPHPRRHLASTSLMLGAAALGMVGLGIGQGTPVLATATLLTFSIGFAWPGLLHHAAIRLHPAHMARATSYMQTGTYVGALLGPLGFGLLVQLSSYRLAWCAAALVAGLAAVVLILAKPSARAIEER